MEKNYRTTVHTENDFNDIPNLAVFVICEDTAKEIAKLAALVVEHGLLQVEKTDFRARYYESNGDVCRTDADVLCVSETMFWFASYIKHTNVEIMTPRQPIAELLAHFGLGASDKPMSCPDVNDEVPVGTPGKLVTLGGVEIRGALGTVHVVTDIEASTRNGDGSLDIDCDGEADIRWAWYTQLKTSAGEAIFVTENGDDVPASQVKLVAE